MYKLKYSIDGENYDSFISDGIDFYNTANQKNTLEIIFDSEVHDYQEFWGIFEYTNHVKIDVSLHSKMGSSGVKNIYPFYAEGMYIFPLSNFNLVDSFQKIVLNIEGKGVFKNFLITKKIEKKNLNFKIMLHSGIGDSLNHISRHKSIDKLKDFFNLKIYWSYGLNSPKMSSEPILKSDVLGRNDIFHYVSWNEYVDINCTELFNGYSGFAYLRDYFYAEKPGFDIKLTKKEIIQLNSLFFSKSGFLVGVQLEGNDHTKRWGEENFIGLFKGILEKFTNTYIFILDQPDRVFTSELVFDERIINLIGVTNLAQNINIIKHLDLWISPDSFSKYVAHWHGTRQIVLDRKAPFSGIPDGESSINEVDHIYGQAGLFSSSRVKILGGDYGIDMNVYNLVKDVKQIPLQEVLGNI